MTDPHDTIDALASRLQPVWRPGDLLVRLALWITCSFAIAIASTVATGPVRPGTGAALAGSPQLLLECAIGLGGVGLSGWAALSLGIPGLATRSRRVGLALGGCALWVAAIAVGFVAPALEPSMAGKRESCELQVLLFSIPPLLLGLLLLRGLATFDRAGPGALLGIAAGTCPALLMQLACMYDPSHAMSHHVAPILGVAALGAMLGPLLLRRI